MNKEDIKLRLQEISQALEKYEQNKHLVKETFKSWSLKDIDTYNNYMDEMIEALEKEMSYLIEQL